MLRTPMLVTAALAVLMAEANENEAGSGKAPETKPADSKTPAKAAPKADSPEAKKAAAASAMVAAQKAAKAAEKAASEAKRLMDEAAVAEADAAGLVLITSPARFGVHIPGKRDAESGKTGEGMIVTIEKGTSRVARDHAEHPYAVAHGVKIIGLPTGD